MTSDDEKMIEKLREKLGAHKKIDEKAELERLFGKTKQSAESKLREKLTVPKHKPGDVVDVGVEKISYGGEGIGRLDHGTVFVPETLPGDTWRVKIVSIGEPIRAEKLEMISPSSDRIRARCAHFEECGGCQLQGLAYPAQLRAKKIMIQDVLHGIGNIDFQVHQIMASSSEYKYRLRTRIKISCDGNTCQAGFFAPKSHRLIPIKACPVLADILNRLMQLIPDNLPSPGTAPLPEEAELACNADETEAAIHLKADEPVLYINELFSKLNNLEPRLTGISAAWQGGGMKAGDPFIHHKVGSYQFQVPPQTFFQSNRYLLRSFMDQVIMLSSPSPKDQVVDFYCGTGFFSIPVSKYVSGLLGVDSDELAIESAIFNNRLNKAGADFICGKDKFARDVFSRDGGNLTLMIVDPPRAGMSSEILSEIVRFKVPRMIYISCNPASFSRDIERLIQSDYRLRIVQPLDMFPQTYHIELIAMLTHRFTSRQAASAVMPDLR